MTSFPRFPFPWALLLLLLVPWTLYVGARIRSLSRGRKIAALTLRAVILCCLVGALAGAEWVKRSDRLAVFFLMDRSSSIPDEAAQWCAQRIRAAGAHYMTSKDDAGVIVFGEQASIELAPGPTLDLGEIRSYVGGEQTDMAAAIRLAVAAFPQGSMKRMVIYSDGNETRGSAAEEVKIAQAAGVAVDVVPIEIGGRNEVRLREVSMPGRVNGQEPFQVRAVVHADQDSSGTLRLFQRTGSGKRLLAEQTVALQQGDNSFLLPQELASAGFYEYVATIESGTDTVLANNEAQAFTIVQGEPRVLYVEADPEHSTYLGPALRAEGLNVTETTVGEMPQSLAQFQGYDAVILSDVSSTDLNVAQLKALEAMERDLGIGLVMIGGPDTFGAGGYQGTPVEKALPVSMDIKQRKILPRGALVLILHTCEIPDGNAWARDIGIAALEVLSSQDLMGCLAFINIQPEWIYELQPVGDKQRMRAALRTAQPGDMPDVGTSLSMALASLKDAAAAVKRVVIISDGDPAAPPPSLVSALAEAKISVSTVCIAPHGTSDQNMLAWIAQSTGGNYYYVTDAQRLPQIFSKEAAVVKRGVLVEEAFTPQVLHESELLQGLQETGLPELLGYVVTTPKDNATVPLISHEKDPILAHWRYGVGKSVAFTSDVTARWAPSWVAWQGFNRFWSQTVRWAMRDVTPTSFRVDTRIKEGKGYIRIDAVDDQGKFVNFLRPKGVVTGPGPEFAHHDVDLMQTAPGIYEGTFPVEDRGIYMVNLSYERGDGSQGMIPSGLALGYSREYEYNTTNHGLLEHLAAVGGGAVRGPEDNPFVHNLPVSATVTPMGAPLMALAACLFPFEIFVRRVVVDFGVVWLALASVLRMLPGIRRWMPQPKQRRKVTTGAFGTDAPARGFTYEAEAARTFESVPRESGTPEATEEPLPYEEPAAVEKKAKPRSEYTQQLLQAKERALKKRDRRNIATESTKDTEDD